MTKIDIISGFLGAGKTTLIKKLLSEAFGDEKIVLIENEFGEIGIDGGFLQDAGVEIREMNSGCICCSLVGDFAEALTKVIEDYAPDRIIIEPSGVGKLSDVIKAVKGVADKENAQMNSFTTVADAQKCKMYMKNFGEFFNNQIENANTIVLSRTQNVSEDKLMNVLHDLKEHNAEATIITTPWDKLDGNDILSAMEEHDDLATELLAESDVCPTCGHHHDHDHEHHHDHDHECCCGHDHDHEHEHEHHHDHDHECCCGHDHDHDHEHEHHHDHDHECCCGHDHHHHHHADDVFTSFGVETAKKYSKDELETILKALADEETYGIILRAKGMLESVDGEWLYFDMVPEEYEIREGKPTYTGRFCVIGSKMNEEALKTLFHVA